MGDVAQPEVGLCGKESPGEVDRGNGEGSGECAANQGKKREGRLVLNEGVRKGVGDVPVGLYVLFTPAGHAAFIVSPLERHGGDVELDDLPITRGPRDGGNYGLGIKVERGSLEIGQTVGNV